MVNGRVKYIHEGYCGFCGETVGVEDMTQKNAPRILHSLCGRVLRFQPRTSWYNRQQKEREGIKRIE